MIDGKKSLSEKIVYDALDKASKIVKNKEPIDIFIQTIGSILYIVIFVIICLSIFIAIKYYWSEYFTFIGCFKKN